MVCGLTYFYAINNTAVYGALDEVCNRVMLIYITIASLLKPVTEGTKLRVAAEMSALDLMLTALQTQKQSTKPSFATQEFKYETIAKWKLY